MKEKGEGVEEEFLEAQKRRAQSGYGSSRQRSGAFYNAGDYEENE